MDLNKIFTDKETQALYNKCALSYDIGNFSFKNKLIVTDDTWKLQCLASEFGTEGVLIDIIADKTGTRMTNVFTGRIHHKTLADIVEVDWHNAKSNPSLSRQTCALVHRNNYYIDLRHLCHSIDMPLSVARDLKTTRWYEALCTFMIAATHYSSIVPHLKWLCSSYYTNSYERNVEMEFVKEALETKTFDGDGVMRFHSTLSSPYCSTVHNDDHTYDYKGFIKEVDTQRYLETVAFGIEVLNRIESIQDSDLKQCIYEMWTLEPEHPITQLLYTKTASGITITPEVANIISINDKKERYYAIGDFLNNHMFEISEAYKTTDVCIDPMFGEFIKFCQNESIMNIRVKTIFMLYDYVMKNGWKDALPNTSTPSDIPIPGSGCIDAEVPEQWSLMNLDRFTHGNLEEDTVNSGSKHKASSGITYEELDRLSSKFEADKYEYNVTTEIDTTDTYRDEYLSISNHMDLLNKNLIRSIKEIKVYNTGGKNPGQKTGKLDRKNLYKYKTSKDIFCTNTYKIKESDLAFGIVLDVSGSMSGEGIRNGRATMIVLHETLKALNINHSIITHNSKYYHQSTIKRYQLFKEDGNFQCNKNYALASIKSGGGNCDSGALYYMEQSMKRVKNKDKICIIFSDGEPTECSDTELKDQVRHMEKNGITVIGVGIDFPSIKEYYNNNANGRNLKEMFEIVSNILKQYVLDKVDKE